MEKENGQWIMCGLDESDPECIGNIDELTAFVDKVGFVPLFQNSVPGFSVEEHTSPNYWWTGHAVKDPWQWRVYAAQQRRVAYGKFFGGKAGFISLKWLGRFANYRREGCDFYTLWREERVSPRQQKIMDCFLRIGELATCDIKKRAGFGRGGEKGFEGTITSLQEKLFLVATDFRRRVTKQGNPYGWDVAVYALPEDLWGDDSTKCAKETPLESYRAITRHFKKLYPRHTERDIVSLIGKAPGSPSPRESQWAMVLPQKPKTAVKKPAAKKAAAKKPAAKKKTAAPKKPAKRARKKAVK